MSDNQHHIDAESQGSSETGTPGVTTPKNIQNSPYSNSLRNKLQNAIMAYTLVAYESMNYHEPGREERSKQQILGEVRNGRLALELQPSETTTDTKAAIIKLLTAGWLGDEWLYDNYELNLRVELLKSGAEYQQKLREMEGLQEVGDSLRENRLPELVIPTPQGSPLQSPPLESSREHSTSDQDTTTNFSDEQWSSQSLAEAQNSYNQNV